MICEEETALQDKKNLLSSTKISIIIPTYNEKDNLKVLVNSLLNTLGKNVKYEIIIVDDNSPDGTGLIAEELSNSIKSVHVIHRPKKLGLASALIDGFRISRGEFIAVTDADLQHSPSIFKKFLDETTRGAELVIASRYVLGGNITSWNLRRRSVSRIATKLAHLFLVKSRKVKDPLSGNFMFKKSKITGVELTGIGWKLLLEIIENCDFKKIVEIPYRFKSRKNGKSKLTYKEYLDFIFLLHLLKSDKVKKKQSNLV